MKKYLFPGPAACLIAVFFALMLAGCGPGLPDKVKQDALDLQAQIRAARAVTADQKKKYENLVKSPGFSPVKKFAQRENWAEKFSLAQAELDRAQSVYDKELAPLIHISNLINAHINTMFSPSTPGDILLYQSPSNIVSPTS